MGAVRPPRLLDARASAIAGATTFGHATGPMGLLRLIFPGQTMCGAPGRSRTDTGDPFRGPASSLGLRGLGNNTPVSGGQLLANRIGLDCFPPRSDIQFITDP